MTGALGFAGVLAGTVAWIVLPLIPAIRELMAPRDAGPRDAGPLDAVGSDSGDLTFFADSFRQFVQTGAYAYAEDKTELPDGRRMARLFADGTTTISAQTGLVVAPPSSTFPEQTECPAELYGVGDLTVGRACTIRAAFSEGLLTLAPHVNVNRWVHGERALAVGDAVQLLGRATSRGAVALGRGVLFDRILAPYIVVGQATVAPSSLSRDAWELHDSRPQFQLARAAAILAPQHWLVDENLDIPEGHIFRGSLVVRGRLRIGANAEIRGSVKAHGLLTIGQGAAVTGTAAGRGDIRLMEDARVYGPVISEGTVTLCDRARVGLPNNPASVSADRIMLHDGAEIFGSLSARREGATAVQA